MSTYRVGNSVVQVEAIPRGWRWSTISGPEVSPEDMEDLLAVLDGEHVNDNTEETPICVAKQQQK